jgi:hypothetical protein
MLERVCHSTSAGDRQNWPGLRGGIVKGASMGGSGRRGDGT